MQSSPDYLRSFADFHVCEATCRVDQREEVILLESRTTAWEEEFLFAVIDGKPFHVHSIHELVHTVPSLVSLSVQHDIRVLWNGVIKKAKLVETFRPKWSVDHPPIASVELTLVVDNNTYQTTPSDSFTEAYIELHELTPEELDWKVCTCYDCKYSGQARDYSNNDREYWCYRDVPDAFAEIQAKGKYASQQARFAGMYYAKTFHTCMAWQPRTKTH
jgi:hypothetical protein